MYNFREESQKKLFLQKSDAKCFLCDLIRGTPWSLIGAVEVLAGATSRRSSRFTAGEEQSGPRFVDRADLEVDQPRSEACRPYVLLAKIDG
jgi:hypothetical protein